MCIPHAHTRARRQQQILGLDEGLRYRAIRFAHAAAVAPLLLVPSLQLRGAIVELTVIASNLSESPHNSHPTGQLLVYLRGVDQPRHRRRWRSCLCLRLRLPASTSTQSENRSRNHTQRRLALRPYGAGADAGAGAGAGGFVSPGPIPASFATSFSQSMVAIVSGCSIDITTHNLSEAL